MTRAYSISAETIAQENQRVGGDLEKFDVSRVIQLDELELREMGSRDVHVRVLVVSAEHNVDHAALADTMNIADVRGGKAPGRESPEECNYFINNGTGVQYAATAALVYQKAKEKGVGTEMPEEWFRWFQR